MKNIREGRYSMDLMNSEQFYKKTYASQALAIPRAKVLVNLTTILSMHKPTFYLLIVFFGAIATHAMGELSIAMY